MLKLYFNNARGEDKFVAYLEDFWGFFDIISSDIHKRNPDYKIPYYRTYASDKAIHIDVGSWDEEYVIKTDNAIEVWNDYMGGK